MNNVEAGCFAPQVKDSKEPTKLHSSHSPITVNENII